MLTLAIIAAQSCFLAAQQTPLRSNFFDGYSLVAIIAMDHHTYDYAVSLVTAIATEYHLNDYAVALVVISTQGTM